jgi:hypothetical protein
LIKAQSETRQRGAPATIKNARSARDRERRREREIYARLAPCALVAPQTRNEVKGEKGRERQQLPSRNRARHVLSAVPDLVDLRKREREREREKKKENC